MNKRIKGATLFSGINTAEYATQLKDLPIDFLFTSEVNKWAIAVQKKNFPDLPCYGDITSVIDRPDLEKVDLAIAGSSCQSFSVNGKGRGLDGSSGILKEFWRYLKVHQPRAFIWENVASVTKPGKRKIFEQILAAFAGNLELDLHPNIRTIESFGGDTAKAAQFKGVKYDVFDNGAGGWAIATPGGYSLAWIVLNAKDTSPQNRERVYMIGFKDRSCLDIYAELRTQRHVAVCAFPAKKEEYQGELQLEKFVSYPPQLNLASILEHPKQPTYLTPKALMQVYEKNREKADPLMRELAEAAKRMAEKGGSLPVEETPFQEGFVSCFEETTRRLLSPTNWGINGQRVTTPCLTVGDASAESEKGGASKGHSGSKKLAIFYVEDGLLKSRRLTEEETERLQGLPPGWTNVEGISGGRRRMLVGNAMAVECVAIALKAVVKLWGLQ